MESKLSNLVVKIRSEDLPKPRNYLAMVVRTRKGGAHQKPHKSIRAKEKVKLKDLV